MNQLTWNPTSDELASILEEMRPIVAAFARRDAARMAVSSAASGWSESGVVDCVPSRAGGGAVLLAV